MHRKLLINVVPGGGKWGSLGSVRLTFSFCYYLKKKFNEDYILLSVSNNNRERSNKVSLEARARRHYICFTLGKGAFEQDVSYLNKC